MHRSVIVGGLGVAIIPPLARPCGRWLDGTRSGALLRVANRPILSHVLSALLEAGLADIAVLAPPQLAAEAQASLQRDGPPGVRLLARDAQVDPTGALQAIAEMAGDGPTVMHRADGLLGSPLRPLLDLLSGEVDALLLVAEDVREEQRLAPTTLRALHLAEIDPTVATLGMAGVCALGSSAIEELMQSRRAPPGLDFTDLAEALAAPRRGRVELHVVREWWAYSGHLRDLLDINRVALDRIQTTVVAPEQRRGNRLEGPVQIDATATVSSCVICGPAVIGAGAIVSDSYVGPHTSIGEHARLEGAEIERSIVFAGASLLHVGRRLVASVVGRDAKVFRDFSVPRAMRLQVCDEDQIALC